MAATLAGVAGALRGPLPRGWEAELYRDERLVGFVGKPDARGDYVFASVPLTRYPCPAM